MPCFKTFREIHPCFVMYVIAVWFCFMCLFYAVIDFTLHFYMYFNLTDGVVGWIQLANSSQISCVGRLIIFSLLESWYVACNPVCGLTSYKLRSSVRTSSLKLSVLCERLGIRIVISGLLIVNHGFRFR